MYRITPIIAAAVLSLGLSRATLTAQEFHDNVVIVLDASGSMKQNMRGTRMNKMDIAKSALKEVLLHVSPSTHIGLVVFSAKNIRDDWIYPLGPRDDEALLRAIDRPEPNRGTPLGEYIKIGADRLLAERQKQYGYGTYRLLVVTDGDASDEDLVERYTPEVIARGITVDVIGVDMEKDHTLATKVHSYRAANDPESLKQAIQAVFAEVGSQGDDAAHSEAFDLLASIPIDVAAAALATLATSGNDPLGGQRADLNEKPSPPGPQPPPVNPTPAPAQKRSSGLLKFLVIGAIILIVLVKAATKR